MKTRPAVPWKRILNNVLQVVQPHATTRAAYAPKWTLFCENCPRKMGIYKPCDFEYADKDKINDLPSKVVWTSTDFWTV